MRKINIIEYEHVESIEVGREALDRRAWFMKM
jgi:hypothetical protein